MKKEEIDKICEKLISLEGFMKLYYSLDEESEFKFWISNHQHRKEIDAFFDTLHQVMPSEFSDALTEAFRGKVSILKKMLKSKKDLYEFLNEHIYTPELFYQEWQAYMGDADDYIEIVLSPDNDDEYAEKIIRLTIKKPPDLGDDDFDL